MPRRYMDPKHEPEPFVRYWALAGAYHGRSPELMSIATRVLDRDEDPLVRRLAEAIFAEKGDEQALDAHSGEAEHRFRTNVNTGYPNASRSWIMSSGVHLGSIVPCVFASTRL